MFGWSLREAETILGLVFRRTDHSCLHWAAKKLPASYLQMLIESASKLIELKCAPDASILDSTGVELSLLHKEGQYRKLHVLAHYCRAKRAVWIAKARETDRGTADITIGLQLLSQVPPPKGGLLLADRGYDAKSLYRLAFRKGWKICMKQRKPFESLRGLRGKVLSSFSLDVYRAFRGRVESIFGGFANRYASLVRERLASAREKASLWWCVSHNMRVLMRLRSALALIC
jgi:hypothetical protein